MSPLRIPAKALSPCDREGWERADLTIRDLFERDSRLSEAKKLARRVRELSGGLDGIIENYTSAVCPSCREVCCINRHGFYALDDLIYVHALGMEPFPFAEGVEETAPCRFLGERGCIFERSVRPFRCNWYFCAPLLRHMEEGAAREYREFSRRFRELQETRQEMLDEFFSQCGGVL